MNVLFLILPLTLVLSVASLVAFAWATRSGQFDDLKTPAFRILHDDDDFAAGRARKAAPPANRN